MLLNCWRRLLRVPWAARSNQSILKEIKPVNPKGNQSWIFFRRTDAEAEALILWLRDAKCWHIGKDWFWESLKAGEEGDSRGQNGWTASLTQWTWVWASSGRWWRTGKPGMLQSMGWQSRTWLSDWTTTKGKIDVDLGNDVLDLTTKSIWNKGKNKQIGIHPFMFNWCILGFL